jgi:hypothetical protein
MFRGEVTMMHRAFAFLALLLLPFSLAAAQQATDSEGESFQGPIRSVDSRMTRHFEGDAEGEDPSRQLDIVTFDSKGNEVERIVYDDYGFLAGKQVLTRDADRRLIESVFSDPEGAVLERQTYVYAGGRLAEIVERDGKGKVVLRQVSTYGDDGLVHEITYYDPDKAAGKTIYRYDAQGRGSEVSFHLADGQKAVAPVGPCFGAHRKTYAYDEKGRSARVVAYQPDGSVKKSWQYSYNPNGYMAEEIVEDAWSVRTSRFSYDYDSRGNWIKRIAVVIDRPKPGDQGSVELREMGPPTSRVVHSRTIAYY